MPCQVQDPWILSDIWELCSRGTSWNFCCTRSNSRCTSWEHAEYIPVASAPRTWAWQVRQVARQMKHDEYLNTFLAGRPPNESFWSWPGPVVCATSHKAWDGCGWFQGEPLTSHSQRKKETGNLNIHKNGLKCCVLLYIENICSCMVLWVSCNTLSNQAVVGNSDCMFHLSTVHFMVILNTTATTVRYKVGTRRRLQNWLKSPFKNNLDSRWDESTKNNQANMLGKSGLPKKVLTLAFLRLGICQISWKSGRLTSQALTVHILVGFQLPGHRWGTSTAKSAMKVVAIQRLRNACAAVAVALAVLSLLLAVITVITLDWSPTQPLSASYYHM